MILYTNRGEVLGEPSLGMDLEDYLFQSSVNEAEIRNRFNRRWKRAIDSAQLSGVSIKKIRPDPKSIEHLLEMYQALEKKNKFVGIDHSLVRIFAAESYKNNHYFNLYEASILDSNSESEVIGYRAIIFSGNTAIDFLVATTELGDKLNVNSSLYWHAICDAKNLGIKFFDVGGMGGETPKGIYDFKNGLGPKLYELVGEWRYYYGFIPTIFKYLYLICGQLNCIVTNIRMLKFTGLDTKA
jgi:lipid II:glycine glycyltransferase (peptidoglycan interpeptide bridge formation enzyme)